MNTISLGKIADVTRGYMISGDPVHVIDSVSTDSRTAGAGCLFIPLVGENHDAHEFLGSARGNGCSAFLISEKEAADKLAGADVVLVSDTLQAMQDLAHYYLTTLDIKKVAVTGSVGKTSTRDMLWYTLSEMFKTARPEKNYNNEVGVPLTIFSLDSSYKAVVLEEGLEHAGDIHRLSAITRPDVCVITNIGVSHIENLGTRENIFRAKLEVADFMPPGGKLIINSDSDFLSRENIDRDLDIIECGTDPSSDYYVHDIRDKGVDGVSFRLRMPSRGECQSRYRDPERARGKDMAGPGDPEHADEILIELPVPGAHNAVNAALAAAAASCFGASPDDIKNGLSKLRLTGKRLLVKEGNGIKIIDDSYNAAPASMKSAVDTLMNTTGRRHVALLAGMNELGKDSEKYHAEVGGYARDKKVDVLIGIGEKARAIVEGASGGAATGAEEQPGDAAQACLGYAGGVRRGNTYAVWFPDKETFYKEMSSIIHSGDTVLVKGSNAYKMSEAAEKLLETYK